MKKQAFNNPPWGHLHHREQSCDVQLFLTPWTAAHQPPLSSTISPSLLKLISIESVMLYNHLILCFPLLLCLQSSFLKKFIYFNWRLITLQYCSGFAYIDMNPPRVYMCSPSWIPFPPPSPSHPSGSSQCTSLEHPVLCIEPGLAIRFTCDNIYVSTPFSHIIPPSPSPAESKRLFYTSVSLLLFRIWGYHYHLSKFHIYVLVYCVGVFLSGLLHSV